MKKIHPPTQDSKNMNNYRKNKIIILVWKQTLTNKTHTERSIQYF